LACIHVCELETCCTQDSHRSIIFLDLEKPDFLMRHYIIGKLLSLKPIKSLIDIGAYYNPIFLFLPSAQCPESVIVIEPILNALSVRIPCQPPNGHKYTHFMFLPITFKYYMTLAAALPQPETVVCIGCDRLHFFLPLM
jgi:hypothetical protein